MTRRVRLRVVRVFVLGGLGGALGAGCSSSTSPHQPTPCPTYSGGVSAGDSLFGVYRLVSYCVDTLPAYGPPVDTGHVTLKHVMAVDSFTAVIGTQGLPADTIIGTYALPGGTDSIHVTGSIKTAIGSAPVQLLGRFLLRHDTLSVSGQLSLPQGAQPLSFTGTRGP